MLEGRYSVVAFEIQLQGLSRATARVAVSVGLRDPTLFAELRNTIEASLQTFGLLGRESVIYHELEALLEDLSSVEKATR